VLDPSSTLSGHMHIFGASEDDRRSVPAPSVGGPEKRKRKLKFSRQTVAREGTGKRQVGGI